MNVSRSLVLANHGSASDPIPDLFILEGRGGTGGRQIVGNSGGVFFIDLIVPPSQDDALTYDSINKKWVPRRGRFGNTGATGYSGPAVTGSTGPDFMSSTGSTGPSGLPATGPTGSSVTGPTGTNGPINVTLTGPTGANPTGPSCGVTGMTGDSPTGPTGLDNTGLSGPSLTGPIGPTASLNTGPTGDTGINVTGPTGPSVTGAVGPTGTPPVLFLNNAAAAVALTSTFRYGSLATLANEKQVAIPMTKNGVLKNLSVAVNPAVPSGGTQTYTLRTGTMIGGLSDTSLVVTLAQNTSTGIDSVHSVSVSQFDVLVVYLSALTNTAPTNVAIGLEMYE